MAVSTKQKVALLLIVAVAFFVSKGNEDNDRYNSLKAKPASELTLDEKKFIQDVERKKAEDEKEKKAHEEARKLKEEQEKPKPLSEEVLLQNAVIFYCEGIAKNTLSYPDSYEIEDRKSGTETKGSKQVFYFTLTYSGVNAFNVRGNHTIECYGTVGDFSRQVTYRVFN